MLSGVLLAGGENRDMNGTNRALLKLGEETFLERQLQQLGQCCDDITIVTHDPSSLLRIVDRSVRIITDYYPVKGPLSGMYAGLALAKHEHVWIAGSHMPYISAAAAKLMLDEKLRTGYEAIIPDIGSADDYLHGIYSKDSAVTAAELLDQGMTELKALLARLNWCGLPESFFRQHWINPKFVTGVHDTADYEQLLKVENEVS